MKKGNSLFGNAVQEYYVDLFRRRAQKNAKKLDAVKTAEQAREYVRSVRDAIRNAFPLPREKCDLRARVTGSVDNGFCRIEKIIYDSRPDYPVTGNLYLPRGKGKHPGVLFLCGHSEEGKAADIYQLCCSNLADKGYVVLAIDPEGQGERDQLRAECGKRAYPSCTREHNRIGREISLAGEVFAAWRAWDAIRGVDYLLTRPEVDASRLGITGNSGGGTMTSWVNVLDDRLTMAAPSCYITSFLHNVENELPVDMEQLPAGLGKTGMEMADLLIAQAPRPMLVMGQKKDFFDPRGTVESYRKAKRIYELLGAGDRLECFIGPTTHGYSQENRTTMYGFFNRIAGIETPAGENPAIRPLNWHELDAAPEGRIDRVPGATTIPERIRKTGLELRRKRLAQPLPDAALKQVLREKLALPARVDAPYYRVLRSTWSSVSKMCFSRFGLETEPGRLMSILKLRMPNPYFYLEKDRPTWLYIPHLDAAEEIDKRNLTRDGILYGLDVRGVGECRPSGCDQNRPDFFELYNADYHYASLGYFLGQPYLGGKVRDILAATALLSDCSGAPVRLLAAGQGIVPAVLAVFLAGPERVADIETIGKVPSWDAMLRQPFSQWPQSCMIPGILQICDLPDLLGKIRKP